MPRWSLDDPRTKKIKKKSNTLNTCLYFRYKPSFRPRIQPWELELLHITPTYIEFGVDAGLSKFIGGMIILVYLLAGIAIGGIIYSEFSKTFKNG